MVHSLSLPLYCLHRTSTLTKPMVLLGMRQAFKSSLTPVHSVHRAEST
jgi:hypothetical protein